MTVLSWISTERWMHWLQAGHIHHKSPSVGLDNRRDKVMAEQTGAEAVENPVYKS